MWSRPNPAHQHLPLPHALHRRSAQCLPRPNRRQELFLPPPRPRNAEIFSSSTGRRVQNKSVKHLRFGKHVGDFPGFCWDFPKILLFNVSRFTWWTILKASVRRWLVASTVDRSEQGQLSASRLNS